MDGVSWSSPVNLLKLEAGRDQAQNGLDWDGVGTHLSTCNYLLTTTMRVLGLL